MAVLNPDVEELRGPAGEEVRHALDAVLEEIARAASLPAAVTDRRGRVLAHNALFENAGALVRLDDAPGVAPLPFMREEGLFLVVDAPVSAALHPEAARAAAAIAAPLVGLVVERDADIQELSRELAGWAAELNLLYESLGALGNVFDEREVCRTILLKAVETFRADRAAFLLNDQDTGSLHFAYAVGLGDDATAAWNLVVVRTAEIAIRERRKLLVREPWEMPPELAALVPPGPPVTLLCSPVGIDGEGYGAVVLVGEQAATEHWPSHLRLLSALTEYAATKIRSSRLFERTRETAALVREMEAARAIQQSLLPQSDPRVPGLDVAASCVPAAFVGGDFYSFVPLPDGRLGIAEVDIAGHGLAAAMMVASIRSTLRSELKFSQSAGQVLTMANEILIEDTRSSGMYATMFFGIFDPGSRRLLYSLAGHPAPFLWRAGSRRMERLSAGGLPVGLFDGESYPEAAVALEPGDVVVIYTDGITEAKAASGERFGEARLAAVVERHLGESARAIHDRLLAALSAHRRGELQADDLTLVVLKAR